MFLALAMAQESLPDVHVDPISGDCLIRYSSADGTLVDLAEIPPNKVEAFAEIDAKSDSSGQFAFQYEIVVATSSRQTVIGLGIEGDTTTVTSTEQPLNWSFLTARLEPFNAFIGGKSKSAVIRPGASLPGFSLQSFALPGISTIRFRGSAPVLAYDEEPPAEVEDLVGRICHRPMERRYALGKTLGPLTNPAGKTGAALILRLMGQKHEARGLNWISGPGADGLVKSLDAKLEAAKAAVDRGQPKTAKNDLRAFLNEVEAQKGKALNNEAYLLLKLNAEFILTKL